MPDYIASNIVISCQFQNHNYTVKCNDKRKIFFLYIDNEECSFKKTVLGYGKIDFTTDDDNVVNITIERDNISLFVNDEQIVHTKMKK